MKIILAHMGGPDNAGDIPVFLNNIFRDREMIKLPLQGLFGPFIAALRRKKSTQNYEKAGWTPVKKITVSIAAKLTKRFEKEGLTVRALYTHLPPYIEEAGEGALVLPLYPHYSAVLAGLMEKRLPGRKVIKQWHSQVGFLDMMQKGAAGALEKLDNGNNKVLLFIAHSIPEYLTKAGDPYIKNVEETYGYLAAKFPGIESSLSYIGKAGPGKWAGPEAAEKVRHAAKAGKKIAAVYLSFPLDNIEVLYDIDIKLKDAALSGGAAGFARAILPNDSDGFTALMEKVIRENL